MAKQTKQPESYELILTDHVPYVNPTDYGIKAEPDLDVNPRRFFTTSGDAVQKAIVMEAETWTAAGVARRKYGKSKLKKQREFVNALWSAAGKCRRLLNVLKTIRGDAVFLESEWRDHRLYVIPKNPRPKK